MTDEPPPTLDALIAWATTLREAERFDAAREVYRNATRAYPDSARAWQHFGALSGQLGHLGEAEAALRRALELVPADAATRYTLAGVLMTQGDYAEAWSFYAARFDLPDLNIHRPPNFPYPQWRSWHAGGKQVLVFPEQGAGDQIQFVRFVPLLVEQGAHVTLLAPRPLYRLFSDSFPQARVIAAEGSVEFPDPDFWVASADLPGLTGATLETLPRPPYLHTTAVWPALPPGFKIGLATRGNPKLTQDRRRSLPNALVERLKRDLPGQVVSLHPEDSGAGDYADTAAIIAQLDLVVSVDTSVAHLAGALGKPCHLLVREFAADWRWMRGRDDSPWYPNTRLYRGGMDGDWSGAIERLVGDVRAFAAAPA